MALRDGSRARTFPKRATGRAAEALLTPRHRNYRSLSMRSPDDFDENLLDEAASEDETGLDDIISRGAADGPLAKQEPQPGADPEERGQTPSVLLQRGASAAPAASSSVAGGAEGGAVFVGKGASPGAGWPHGDSRAIIQEGTAPTGSSVLPHPSLEPPNPV